MSEQGLTNTLLAENEWYKAEVARLRDDYERVLKLIFTLRCEDYRQNGAQTCISCRARTPDYPLCTICQLKEAAGIDKFAFSGSDDAKQAAAQALDKP